MSAFYQLPNAFCQNSRLKEYLFLSRHFLLDFCTFFLNQFSHLLLLFCFLRSCVDRSKLLLLLLLLIVVHNLAKHKLHYPCHLLLVSIEFLPSSHSFSQERPPDLFFKFSEKLSWHFYLLFDVVVHIAKMIIYNSSNWLASISFKSH